jgi:hypothetical protein
MKKETSLGMKKETPLGSKKAIFFTLNEVEG